MEESEITRISYTNKATVPASYPYSNQSPSYTITKEFVHKPGEEAHFELEMETIKEYVDGMIRRDFENMLNFKIKETPPESHYRLIDGVKVPRVTSIITPDTPPIPFIEDHAELGSKLDEMMKIYIDTDIWAYDDFQDKGNIKQTWDDLYLAMYNQIANLRKDNVQFTGHSVSVYNPEHNYCGELDALAMVEAEHCIVDFKKTKKLTTELINKYFMQMSAYVECLDTHIDKMIIITPYETQIANDFGYFFGEFLMKLAEYRERFKYD